MSEVTLDFVLEVARAAGGLMKDGFENAKSVSQKCSLADLVTETDTRVEEFVKRVIQEAYPSHSFIGEESVSQGAKIDYTDNPTWIIDPIDGTTNFVHQFEFFGISIAYAVNKEVEIAVVYNPAMEHVYHAVKGKGAFLNGQPIHVGNTAGLSTALICSEWGSQRDSTLEIKVQNMHRAVSKSRGIRSIGSAAISCCLVASGSVDAYFEFGIHCWDVAAGELIVREAGGVSFHPDGSAFDLMSRSVLVACNTTVAKELSQCVQKIDFDRE